MIKRIIACVTICLIITGLISPVFSDASALPQPNWSDPGISEIINISDLTGWMLNGGTYDVSRYTDAESFMNDYFYSRTQTRLVSPGEAAEDYYEVLPGFGINNQLVPGDSFARPLDTNRVITSSFRDHTGYGRRFSIQANEALLDSGSLYNMKIPLLNEVEFANFVGYNHDALRLYSEFFNNDDDQPDAPDLPTEFAFLENIKDSMWGLRNNNVNIWQSGMLITSVNSSNPDLRNLNYNPINSSAYYSQGALHNQGTNQINNYLFTSLGTVYITDTGNSVTCSYNGFVPNMTIQQYYLAQVANLNVVNGFLNFDNVTWGEGSYTLPFQTSFAGLSTCVNYLYDHFAHINIYYNGDPWILVNAPEPPPTITPEFPDAVGGEDLPSTTWPVHRPLAPYYISAPGMLQAIQDAIDDDGELDIDDLKPYLTDENGDPVPDPQFDPEPVPIPVPDPVNPDVVPGLPILPAMPPEMPGFSGVSVLAEIINFTNQSLPTALIVTFWGIIFGIVILGLIKILHK